jgi:hypothetical protein
LVLRPAQGTASNQAHPARLHLDGFNEPGPRLKNGALAGSHDRGAAA